MTLTELQDEIEQILRQLLAIQSHIENLEKQTGAKEQGD